MAKVHPEFQRRLEQACENRGGQVPQHNFGRLNYFVEEMRKRFEVSITRETVRKWFTGESKPRDLTMLRLAQILQVDPAWLSLGSNTALPIKEQQIRNAAAEGVVNIVAGLVQIPRGNALAFPLAADTDARDAQIDMRVIIKGASYALHVVLADKSTKDGAYTFSVPTVALERCIVIGVIMAETEFTFTLVELDGDSLMEIGVRRNSHVEVDVDDNLRTGDHQWRKITSFAERF